MNYRIPVAIATLSAIAVSGLWWATEPPEPVSDASLSALSANAERGASVFHIGGCASCHQPVDYERKGNEIPPLGGGRRFETGFGTFVAPNITPHAETGIGGWSIQDFATAMLQGVSPDGKHYYPAFPYASYIRMTLQDVVDLKAFMDRLPAVQRENEPHELGFPFSIRRFLGIWKRLHLDSKPRVQLQDATDDQLRGQYLVEGPGHCGECHTPRSLTGGMLSSRWLSGAPSPDGDGDIPNITSHENGINEWKLVDISEYLSSGFKPDYDVAGSSMADVIDNTSRLPESDRQAIAAYLKAVPEIP